MKNRGTLLWVLLAAALVLGLIVSVSAAGSSRVGPPLDEPPVSNPAAGTSSAASAMDLNTPEAKVFPMVAVGYAHTVGLKSDGTVVAVGSNYSGECDVGGWRDIIQIAAGGGHTVGLKSDGTAVAVGDNDDGQCDVGGWADIVQVAAGGGHTVGLKSDSTVIAVGSNNDGQCDVGEWTDIVQVAAGRYHTVGLKSDGTVVAVGDNDDGQCNVDFWTDIIQVAAGSSHTVGLRSDGTVVAVGDNEYGQCDVGGWVDIVQVAAGYYHTVGLQSDGTVVAVGSNYGGKCDVGGWADIVQVAAGSSHTVGLRSDGTVVAVGDNEYGQRDVGGWTDITQVAAGYSHTVGLESDGTVVAVGWNYHGQCDVDGWTGITQVAAGPYHTRGLKSDGTVVAVGDNDDGQCDVGSWTDVVQVAAGLSHTVGLESDGTVVAVGSNYYGQCDVGGWTDIIQVAAVSSHTVGLKSDGTAVAVGYKPYGVGNVGSWTDIIQVAAGWHHTVGLKSDGTVVAVGDNDDGQCDVGSWTDIVQVAAGSSHTVGLKSDGTVVAVGYNYQGQCSVNGLTDITHVAALGTRTVVLKSDGVPVAVGFGTELAQWNLGVTRYDITISSTAGGSVTTPGEGIHTYGFKGTVVNLTAEPRQGYRFVRWTGDVSTVGDVNAASTNITVRDDYSLTANFNIPPIQYDLTITSTAKGSVITPGNGTFSYDEGTMVNLVAEPEKGYRFLGWTGDVDTVADVDATSTTISTDGDYSIAANFGSVRAGDWIKYEYKIKGWSASQPRPEWLELEFLSVVGTRANVLVTLNMSDGTEQSDTVPVDLGEGGGEALGFSGLIIPPNLSKGDSIYISGYEDVTIESETTRNYAGARRRVIYASFSQDEVQLTYYWDKQTGVMVEASATSEDMTITSKVIETNMWEVETWRLWTIIAVAIAVVTFVVYCMKKGKTAIVCITSRRLLTGIFQALRQFPWKKRKAPTAPISFRRQLAKDFLWLLLYPVYQTIGTLRHEGSHALAAMAEGADIKEFVFWYTPGRFGYVSWQGSTTWFTTAAPYFCDLITFFAAFSIVLIVKPRPRWLWFNILLIGMLSPFINSLHNYRVGLAGTWNDVGALLSALDPLAVHLYFVITLLLYAWGIYYCYFRKKHQV